MTEQEPVNDRDRIRDDGELARVDRSTHEHSSSGTAEARRAVIGSGNRRMSIHLPEPRRLDAP